MACPSDAKPHSDNLNSATTGSLAVAPGRDDGNGALTVIGLEQMMRLVRSMCTRLAVCIGDERAESK